MTVVHVIDRWKNGWVDIIKNCDECAYVPYEKNNVLCTFHRRLIIGITKALGEYPLY